MIWIDDINELDYYNPTTLPVPCYCELIMQPDDLYLQAPIGTETGSIDVRVETYEADGISLIEVIDDSFYNFELVTDALGNRYVNIRFIRFTELMCNNPCFIFRVKIHRVIRRQLYQTRRLIFDKYTQRYCLHDCCIIPSQVVVQTGNQSGNGEYSELDYGDEYFNVQ